MMDSMHYAKDVGYPLSGRAKLDERYGPLIAEPVILTSLLIFSSLKFKYHWNQKIEKKSNTDSGRVHGKAKNLHYNRAKSLNKMNL